ncbi:hypothetical protein B0H11DRAFT_1902466 [Mycena galericulata]|nr:hypothetical protein B0H11DRAFT_1902466 [Mycena galericulata]
MSILAKLLLTPAPAPETATLPVTVDAQDILACSTRSRAQNRGNIPFHAHLCARPAPAPETHASPSGMSGQNVLGSTAALPQDWDHWLVDSSPEDTDSFSLPPGFPFKMEESSASRLDDPRGPYEMANIEAPNTLRLQLQLVPSIRSRFPLLEAQLDLGRLWSLVTLPAIFQRNSSNPPHILRNNAQDEALELRVLRPRQRELLVIRRHGKQNGTARTVRIAAAMTRYDTKRPHTTNGAGASQTDEQIPSDATTSTIPPFCDIFRTLQLFEVATFGVVLIVCIKFKFELGKCLYG